MFRQQLESIRAFSKKESPIEDFACEYLEGKIKISQANTSISGIVARLEANRVVAFTVVAFRVEANRVVAKQGGR